MVTGMLFLVPIIMLLGVTIYRLLSYYRGQLHAKREAYLANESKGVKALHKLLNALDDRSVSIDVQSERVAEAKREGWRLINRIEEKTKRKLASTCDATIVQLADHHHYHQGERRTP